MSFISPFLAEIGDHYKDPQQPKKEPHRTEEGLSAECLGLVVEIEEIE